MSLRPANPADREALARLVEGIENFNREEVQVALELIDASLAAPGRDYNTIVASTAEGALVGYLCYGHTPMTEASYDLYWMAVQGDLRGRGLGRALVEECERRAREAGGRLVRIETSSLESYGGTLEFYLRLGYEEVGRIADFYRAGDDLITLVRRLAPAP